MIIDKKNSNIFNMLRKTFGEQKFYCDANVGGGQDLVVFLVGS